ncbi:MAG: AIM24 family protein [Deltaproteobacteria bacterium]|nr:AIM24 family protein [Deltaproteobacteria bacterium]MBW2363343.1 AIM24 family protein [Deltaproteobacteria bacterium]
MSHPLVDAPDLAEPALAADLPHIGADPATPEEDEPREAAALRNEGLVGSFIWTLRKGDRWVLAPESAFLFTDCWRKTLVREAYMHLRPSGRRQVLRESLATLARRFITGEPALLDLYVAERDGAELGISSDELGGSLYATRVDRGPLICRKAVYFGSEQALTLRPVSPLQKLRRGLPRSEILDILKRSAYGPGWIFQRFVARSDEHDTLILQIDGDVYFRELAEGETLRTDPRHCYAWDETVSHRLIRFGSITDRLLRGSVPFQVEFEGPGRLWLSNMSFADGYLGSIFTPSHWVFYTQQLVLRLLRALNPFTWV